jgi:vacuolar-type H+-ATPase subunit E/Vma4
MTRFAGILDHQVQRLRDALRRQQEARCREIIATAERKAKLAIRDSRQKLHERQRQAVGEERQRRAHELLIAKSRVETLERRRAFARHEEVLKDAQPLLVEALENRWSDSGQRLAWCNMIVAEAVASLMGPDWVVEHPANLAQGDRDAIANRVRQSRGESPRFVACQDITSGLRIRTTAACLDGTIAGLLGDREDVEAQLLAAWERLDGGDDV